MLDKPIPAVVVEHFGPQVGVVARRVTAAPDVRKVGRTVARRHLCHRHAKRLQLGGLKRACIHRRLGRSDGVPCQVQQCRSQILSRGIALVERLGLANLGDRLCRHRRPGLPVLGVVGQHAGLGGEVLVELRRELHVVARHVGAREQRVAHLRQHAVQRVPKLMEHRRHVVKAQQRRLPRRGLREIADIVDDGLRAWERSLVDEAVHPSAAALVVALVVVGIEQRDHPVLVVHFKDLHVRVVDRQILALDKGEPIELPRRKEDAIAQHPIEQEVGFDRRLVEVVLRLAHLLRVVLPIPSGEREGLRPLVDDRLHLGDFAARPRSRSRHHVGEQLDRRALGLGHLVIQRVARIVVEPEQFRLLRAQRRDLQHNRARVVSAATAARHRRLQNLPTQSAVGQ